jgi:class 3 adenylate cyclase/predicted ATPase
LDQKTSNPERRQLTVMFSELEGVTQLSGALDPEDFSQLVRPRLEAWDAIIKRYGGFVAKHTGQGVLAYFGYPAGHEDDAERTAHTALEIVEATRALSSAEQQTTAQISVRIGIATGIVVVGGAIGQGASKEEQAFGLPLNLAARLQAFAEPNSILIAPETRQLIGSKFDCEDAGCRELKGISESINVWRVVRPRTSLSRFFARHTEGVLPLVGRSSELDVLLQSWSRVGKDGGQVVFVSGEPGIGKSHLCEAFLARIAPDRHTAIHCQCSGYHANTAFQPLVEEIERSAGMFREDGLDARLDKLERVLSEWSDQADRLTPVFAALLSLPTAGRYPDFAPGARELRKMFIAGLVERLRLLSRCNPVVFLFEDAQWSDPSTQDFLAAAIESVGSARVLILITARPEFKFPWRGRAHVTELVLEHLDKYHATQMVRLLAESHSLPDAVLAHIVDHTDGVPLFIEELTRSLQDLHAPKIDARPVVPVTAVSIPATLRDSLMARLDRLGMAKPVAQLGATIGRTFPYWLLLCLWPFGEEALRASLDEIERAGLLKQRQHGSEVYYVFKHELVRDAAYESLLKSKREALHMQIAQLVTEERGSFAETPPELIAYHYTAAGRTEPAIKNWRKAGAQALQRSANVEAVGHFTRALELLEHIPHSEERDQRELDLRTQLGATLTAVKGFGAVEVEAAYARARVLCGQSKDATQRFAVLRGLWVYDLVRAEWSEASALAEEMLGVATREANAAFELEARRAMGMTLLWRGDLNEALAHLQRGRCIYDAEKHHGHAYQYGNDPGVACLVHEAFVLCVLGFADQALLRSEDSIALARQLSHPFSLTQALIYRAFVHQCCREADPTRKFAGEAQALAREHSFPFWLAEATMLQGWAMAQQGDATEGLDLLREGLAAFRATGAKMDQPRWLATLAEAHLCAHQPGEGLTAVAEALAVVELTKECFFAARLHGLRAELLIQQGSALQAEACLQESLSIARSQKAKTWELRAATRLARLWWEQSRGRDARDLLASVYGSFSEGFATPDLRDAERLLEERA